MPELGSSTTRHGGVAAAAATATVAAAVLGAAMLAPHHPALKLASARSALSVPGRGASVPFTEYEADDAATNGTVLASSRLRNTLAGEATGRQAVTLSGSGRYVEFTLTKPANAVDIRYSIPDSANGQGQTAPLAVYVNGAHNQDLTLTSKYSWFYGTYPFSNNPGDGNPHHFYDDVRTTFASTLPQGTKVKLQVDSGSVPETIDVADFEQIAPLSQPAGSLSALDYGADPTGAADSGSALTNAINAASTQGKVLWIPAGTYTVNQHLIVNNVTIRGAGPWYTVLHGNGVGVYGNYAPTPSGNVKLYDFAIFGETIDRNDGAQVNGIGGALGGGSVASDIWIQHTKVGLWMDGPFDGFTVTNCRIQDVTADGLNLHDGISHTTVTQNFIRNTGDDGLATWSEQNADHDDTFSFNTVELPMLANGIAVYGGHDISVTDSVVADTQTNGGGIHVANRFNSVPMAGTTTIARDTTLRAGNLDPNWNFGVGALWFDALNAPMNGTVNVTDTDLLDSSYEAIQWVEGSSISNVNFNHVNIDGAGTFALQIQVGGSASFTNVTAAHLGASNPIYNCLGAGAFTINQGSGNSGWYTSTPYCGPWPDPVYGGGNPPPTTPPPTTGPPTGPPTCQRNATASSSTQGYLPANTIDGDANTYWESANNAFPQTLTVDNCTASTVGSVTLRLPPSSAWGARTQTLSVSGSTNGSSYSTLAASAGYLFDPATGNQVTISFNPTSVRYLRLTFTANTGWPAAQVSELTTAAGGGGGGNPDLAAGKAMSASGSTDVYTPDKANDGDTGSYWESADNAFPQWVQVDLGAATGVGRIVLALPGSWPARTETFAVLGSTDGSSFSTVLGPAGHAFDPASGNTVTLTFAPATVRYLRLNFTANTGWPAGQVSELRAYAS
ncbi:MAG: discoidin domain-containing protein [Mycobacteriales bacterium]